MLQSAVLAATMALGRTVSATLPAAHNFYSNSIKDFLTGVENRSVAGIGLRNLNALKEIYPARYYAPLWCVDGNSTNTSKQIVKKLLASSQLGLEPSKYFAQLLQFQATNATKNQFLQFELLLTDSLFSFFDDLAHGTILPPAREYGWRMENASIDVNTISKDFFSGNDSFHQSISKLQPDHPRYNQLVNSLHEHLSAEDDGGWPLVPAGNTLQLNDNDPRVAILRERLAASGDMRHGSYSIDHQFDENMSTGLQDFQKRHGLVTDAILGPKTLEQLNIPLSRRIAQIQTNLNRWRWLNRDLGLSNITVNTAGFELDVSINGNIAKTMKVIVGKPENKTPVFSDTMEHLVFNPSWYVPKSIVRELLPKEVLSPGWFTENNFEISHRSSNTLATVSQISVDSLDTEYFVTNYRVRQLPGDSNALGRLKFMFPNPYSVYLHDTNAKALFDHSSRAFSHGCVRLENPESLAELLLLADGKSHSEIDSYFLAETTKKVLLRSPLPVHMTYQTAWVDEQGKTHFRDDIYDFDKHSYRELNGNKALYAALEKEALSSTNMTVASNTY